MPVGIESLLDPTRFFIEFTQFLRPNGERRPYSAQVSKEVYDKAQQIVEAGLRFECEVLAMGPVSFTITDDDADWAIELVENGPKVPDAIDRMVMDFDLDASRTVD